MKPSQELRSAADYARTIRPLLPKDAFRADPRHAWRIALHLGLFVSAIVLLRELPLWTAPLWSIVAGHSIACLGFLAHDVSHGCVVRNRLATRLLELALFGLNAIPPTVWRRVHNQSHHAETNTPEDPDRAFLECERSRSTEIYARIFYPGRHSRWWRPLVFLHFVAYILRNTVASLLPEGNKPAVVPSVPTYTVGQRAAILLELLWILLIQAGVWICVSGDLPRFLWASPVALLIASSVIMAYVFTNHFLNPLCEHSDPVAGSTSVIVPKWIDWMHDHFSYHTEHHLFPGMSPKHFPEVSRFLQEHFSDRYRRISFAEAWRRLWEGSGFST